MSKDSDNKPWTEEVQPERPLGDILAQFTNYDMFVDGDYNTRWKVISGPARTFIGDSKLTLAFMTLMNDKGDLCLLSLDILARQHHDCITLLHANMVHYQDLLKREFKACTNHIFNDNEFCHIIELVTSGESPKHIWKHLAPHTFDDILEDDESEIEEYDIGHIVNPLVEVINIQRDTILFLRGHMATQTEVQEYLENQKAEIEKIQGSVEAEVRFNTLLNRLD